jgi:hypothetical protein
MGERRGPNRREFLKEAAVGIGMTALGAKGTVLGAAPDEQMPRVALGRYEVSRLILGSNPILGYSHVSDLMSRVMTDYFTLERIQQLLLRCLEARISTWQSSAHEKVDQSLKALRESGKNIQWIFLAAQPHTDDAAALRETIKRNEPIAIVHHGGVSDSLWREGKIEKAHDFAKRVQDLGVLAGLSAHNPDVIKNAEDKGWNLDLYMTCFYRVTRTHAELQKEVGMQEVPFGEIYLQGDPARMCEVVRQVKRPCLAFKILAAGRRCERPQDVEAAFEFAFKSIKRTDAVIVGMFPRYRDEPGENAALARRFSG